MTTEPRQEQLEFFEDEEQDALEKEQKRLWEEVLDTGDTDALRKLAREMSQVDDRELGGGD